MKRIFKAIRHFFEVYANAASIRLKRERSVVNVFDLVSFNEHPETKDIYMIYSLSDTDVYFINLRKYFERREFDAGDDKQVVYPFHQVKDNLYKVDNASITPYNILSNSSLVELRTYAMRFEQVFSLDPPLLGIFKDPRDKHLMLILNKKGDVETGTCDVYDIDRARSFGILHTKQISHRVKTRHLLNTQVIKPLDKNDFLNLFGGPWNREIIKDISLRMFDAVRTTSMKFDKFRIYSKGITLTQDLSKPESSTKETKEKEVKQ